MTHPLPILGVLAGTAFLAAIALGDQPLTPLQIWGALTGGEAAAGAARIIVVDLRLPRALTGLIVGAALGVAGAICQAILRNPLADPGILGINAGAALAAMLVIVEIGSVPESLLPWATFLGALTISGLIFGLSWRGGTTALRLVLVGIGLSAFAGAGASVISTYGDVALVQRAMVWLAGSLQGSRWDALPRLLAWSVPVILAVWLAARELDLIAMGDDVARGRGQRANVVRAAMILACAMVCGAAVAAAGPIAFVGLAAPHIARGLAGTGHARLIPAAALTGAIMLLVADLVARRVMPPAQLPVGVVTALLGAPFFGWLLWRRRDG